MNTRIWTSLLFIGFGSASPAGADVTFSGYMVAGDSVQFVLTGVQSQATSRWLRLGDRFEGHRIVSFDPTKEVLRVAHADREIDLPLKDAFIRHVVTSSDDFRTYIENLPISGAKVGPPVGLIYLNRSTYYQAVTEGQFVDRDRKIRLVSVSTAQGTTTMLFEDDSGAKHYRRLVSR